MLRGHYGKRREETRGRLPLEPLKQMKSIAEASPRLKARMAGVFYVLAGLASVIGGMYIPGKLVVPGDAATTANAILTHRHLFELGFSVMLIAVVCSIVLTALF